MRYSHNILKTAVPKSQTLPFAGLGFDTGAVQTMAQTMAPNYCSFGSVEPSLPVLDSVSQPSGYKLLVTLGREIRGR